MKKILNEMPWVSVQQKLSIPTSTGRTVQVDFIDIRLENMIKDGFVDRAAAKGWYAKLPKSDTFLHDDGTVTDVPKDNAVQLPDGWWEYSYGLLNDQNVKASKHPRTEQGELSQQELDDAIKQSYRQKLDRVFS